MAEIVIAQTPAEGGELVAGHIAELVLSNPQVVLGVATGSTPLPVYENLRHRISEGFLALGQTTIFALDEYVGLPANHAESYHSVVERELVSPLGLDPGRVHVPDGTADYIRDAGQRYEAEIRAAGGIHLQILGIGTDGHIGFNEPGSSFASETRVKTLTEQTRRDNARFFASPDEVPHHCITQGLGTILRARHLILLAFGQSKAAAVASAIEGPLSAQCPASVIQLHPRVTVVIDEAAASELRNREYYRYSWENKPPWQGL